MSESHPATAPESPIPAIKKENRTFCPVLYGTIILLLYVPFHAMLGAFPERVKIGDCTNCTNCTKTVIQ